jgi:hypothetical protein
MSLETQSLKLAAAMEKMAYAGLSEKVQSCIKGRAIAGGIVMAIPLWGAETLIYTIILWSMYVELCKLARVPFLKNFFTSILGGFIVNIIVVFILNLILDFIPIAGWIAAAIMGYCATLFSGCGYLEVLAALHQKGKVKERFNTNKAISSINNKE